MHKSLKLIYCIVQKKLYKNSLTSVGVNIRWMCVQKTMRANWSIFSFIYIHNFYIYLFEVLCNLLWNQRQIEFGKKRLGVDRNKKRTVLIYIHYRMQIIIINDATKKCQNYCWVFVKNRLFRKVKSLLAMMSFGSNAQILQLYRIIVR